MTAHVMLPRMRGRVSYRSLTSGSEWGFEDWSITRGSDGLRVMQAHCEMTFGGETIIRDSILSVQRDWHPRDASVRIMRDGALSGTGWFLFGDDEVECESWSVAEGRLRQTMPISRPIRGFGIHAVTGDGWLAAGFPYEEGPGHTQYYGRNLLHSLHHFGATGPSIATSESGLLYVGLENVEVPAGRFDCHRLRFVGMKNDHPVYDMWISSEGDFLFVKGIVEGYMESEFLLDSLTRENSA